MHFLVFYFHRVDASAGKRGLAVQIPDDDQRVLDLHWEVHSGTSRAGAFFGRCWDFLVLDRLLLNNVGLQSIIPSFFENFDPRFDILLNFAKFRQKYPEIVANKNCNVCFVT